MKIKVKREETVDVVFLQVSAGVRYWDDATVNGKKDEEGNLIPFRYGDYWKPKININTGVVVDWPNGTTADIHYKICDNGVYTLLDEGGAKIVEIEGYVPSIMCPKGEGYGDYIKMKIDGNGLIENWKPNLSDFSDNDED